MPYEIVLGVELRFAAPVLRSEHERRVLGREYDEAPIGTRVLSQIPATGALSWPVCHLCCRVRTGWPIVSVPMSDGRCDVLELFAGCGMAGWATAGEHPVAAVLALAARRSWPLRNLAIGALQLAGRVDVTEAIRWARPSMDRPSTSSDSHHDLGTVARSLTSFARNMRVSRIRPRAINP